MARDLLFFLSGNNLNFVCREPQGFKPFRGRRPNVVAVLSDAAGEDHNIYTAQQSHVGADHLAHRDSKNIQRQSGFRVAGAGALFQGLDVALAGRETEKATLMIQQSFQLVGVELFIAQKINDHARVEITRPRAHRNAASGSETHRSVDRYPVSQRTETRSVPQVRKDGALGNLCAEVMHQRFIGNTVEAIAPNSRVEVAAWKRESRCDLWDGLVKSVVEACEVRGRGEDRLGGRNERQRLRNVQGSEVGCRAQFIQDLRSDELVLTELWAAMDDAVAYSYWTCMNMLADCRSEKSECMALRFVNTLALYQRSSVGRTNMQSAIVMPDTIGGSRSAAALHRSMPR